MMVLDGLHAVMSQPVVRLAVMIIVCPLSNDNNLLWGTWATAWPGAQVCYDLWMCQSKGMHVCTCYITNCS